jgi:hypothetical protein
MAKIKFGNVIVDMKGSIAGNTYSKNKGGAYSRVKVVPSNPQSTAQMAVRAIFTVLSQAWRGLSAVQRQSWISGVGNYARINNMGDSHNLSGNSLFVSLNKNLADVGLPQIDVCPSPESVETVDVSVASADNSAQTVTLTLGAVVPANTSLKLFMTEALSAGVASPGTKLRQIASYGNGDAAALAPTAAYLAKFGTVGDAGAKIFYEIVPVNETTGQKGASIRGSIVIAA